MQSEVLFLGGRSGVGKSSVAFELHAQLAATARLRRRIQGSDFQEHVDRSKAAARELDLRTPQWVHRCPTDNRSVQDIAADLLPLTGWTANPAG